MILHTFRKHLSEELEKIPANAEQAFESYAVTTAALGRRLMEYLKIDDLSVSNGLSGGPPDYPLRTVLDRILHFRVLHQDAMTFAIPHESDLFTLYSDQTQEGDEHLYIRLGEYRDVVGRVANDDVYVAHHLFRRSVTLLHKLTRESSMPVDPRAELKHAEFRKWVHGMVCNAWILLVTLMESGEVTCPEVDIECYEWCKGDGTEAHLQRFSPICAGRDLVHGHGPHWWWAPFTPSKVEIGGHQTYCVHLSAIKSEAERTRSRLHVTFDSFIEMFQDARRQLAGALSLERAKERLSG